MIIDPHFSNAEFIADMKKIDTAMNLVKTTFEKHGNHLTPEERKRMPKPSDGMLKAAKNFMRAVIAHPKLAAGTGSDPQLILHLLDALDLLDALIQAVGNVSALLADTRLTWAGWLDNKLLELYGVAKVLAKNDASMQEPLKEFAPYFPGHPGTPAPDNNPPPDNPPSTESKKK